MKALFISYDQAHHDAVLAILNSCMQRGFTCFEQTQGRGTVSGEPHYGSHAWPSMNSSILAMCDDDRIPLLLDRLKKLDAERPMLGLRAFVLPVEQAI